MNAHLRAIVSVLFLMVIASSVQARPLHWGGFNTCPMGAGWNDGCIGAPQQGLIKFPNFFTDSTNGFVRHGVARQSGQAAYALIAPSNVAGVSYGVGPDMAVISHQLCPGSNGLMTTGNCLPGGWKDVQWIGNDPAVHGGCTFSPNGSNLGGPLVNCGNNTSPDIDLEGYDFSKTTVSGTTYNCVPFLAGQGSTVVNGKFTFKNNRVVNGWNCNAVYATGSGYQGVTLLGYVQAVSGQGSNELLCVAAVQYGGTGVVSTDVTVGGKIVYIQGGTHEQPTDTISATGGPGGATCTNGGGYTYAAFTIGDIYGNQSGSPSAPTMIGEGTGIVTVESWTGVTQHDSTMGSPATGVQKAPTHGGTYVQGQDGLKLGLFPNFTSLTACSDSACTSPAFTINVGGTGWAPRQNLTFGNPGNQNLVFVEANAKTTVQGVLFSQNLVDGCARSVCDVASNGGASDPSCCGMTFSLSGVNIAVGQGEADMTYNAFFDLRTRDVTFGSTGPTRIDYNYVEGFGYNIVDQHGEFNIDAVCNTAVTNVPPCVTRPLIEYVGNTMLQPTNVAPIGTSMIYATTQNPSQPITQTTISQNTLVANLVGGAGGVAFGSAMVEVDTGKNVYTNITLDRNYMDAPYDGSFPNCWEDPDSNATTYSASSIPAAIASGYNPSMATGANQSTRNTKCQ